MVETKEAPGSEIIAVEGLWHVYGEGDDAVVALKDISFSVARGEFVAIVGANGSGKSTLAKHLNGLLLPSKGTVTVAGKLVAPDDLWHARQTVGMVFQNPDNQMVATTVEEDVAFGPENLGVGAQEIGRRVSGSLQIVGMAGFERKAPHHLSGGQKQRVAIAGVLAMEPDVMVLDEPTAMLDPEGRGEVLSTVARLNRELGVTVILITHFMSEASLADRVMVMDHGQFVLEGRPREIFSHAELLGQYGLGVPQVTMLAHNLRKRGLEIEPGILQVTELVDALCPLLSKT